MNVNQQLSRPKETPSAASAPDLGMDVAGAVFRLARRLRAERIDDQLGDTQYAVLFFLTREGPHSLKELSIRERVTPPSMNQTVNALETAGYVERRDDPDDRRKVLLAATEAGISMAKQTRRLRHAWINARLKELTPAQRESVQRAALVLQELADS